MRRTYLEVSGNHSIVFNGKAIADKEDVINRLNSLKFEESEFVLEECKRWYMRDGSFEKSKKKGKEWFWKTSFERDLKVRSWTITCETPNYDKFTDAYTLAGPFGLKMWILKHYIDIKLSIWHFHRDVTKEEYTEWRNSWRPYFNQIIRVLGGNRALYIPDDSVKLFDYVPYGPENSYNFLIYTVLNNYPNCLIASVKTMEEGTDDAQEIPFFVENIDDVETIDNHK